MCRFCEKDNFGELCEKIKEKGIDIGDVKNALALNLWIMNDKKYGHVLEVNLDDMKCGTIYSSFKVHIRYCPFCGKKLMYSNSEEKSL